MFRSSCRDVHSSRTRECVKLNRKICSMRKAKVVKTREKVKNIEKEKLCSARRALAHFSNVNWWKSCASLHACVCMCREKHKLVLFRPSHFAFTIFILKFFLHVLDIDKVQNCCAVCGAISKVSLRADGEFGWLYYTRLFHLHLIVNFNFFFCSLPWAVLCVCERHVDRILNILYMHVCTFAPASCLKSK